MNAAQVGGGLNQVMRGRKGLRIRDGARFLEPQSAAGAACGCAPTWRQRRSASRAGRGPKPEITARFRLAGALEIGRDGAFPSLLAPVHQ